MTKKEQPHYHGHRQRLKDRLNEHAASLQDYELLELVLATVLPRRDTKPLAKALLARCGGLRQVMDTPVELLSEVDGFGPALATHWQLLRELRARLGEGQLLSREVLNNQEDIVFAAMERFGRNRHEEMWCAFLDAKNRVLAWERIAEGEPDYVLARPKAIVERAFKHKAASFVMVHNHPGGDPTPSPEDKRMTMELADLARRMDLRLLDHIIVSESKYYSFRAYGAFLEVEQ